MDTAHLASPLTVHFRSIDSLNPNVRNARLHSKRQIRQIADSIRTFGFLSPILIDETGTVLAGHGRLAAAKQLGMDQVPTLLANGLNETQKRAYVLADNKLAEKAGWDRDILAAELGELAILLPEINCDLTLTGFEPAEIDLIFADRDSPKSDPGDEVPELSPSPVSLMGDLWCLGHIAFSAVTRDLPVMLIG